MVTLMKLVVVGSAAYVYYDATKNRIGKVPGDAAFPNISAGVWALSTVFLWLVFFPMYFYKRAVLLERAQAQPQEAARVTMKLALFGLLFLALLLKGLLGGGAGSITFAEQVDQDLNTVNEGSEFSTGWVHMVIRANERFDDPNLTVFVKAEGSSAWIPAEQHVVSPEWDTYATPVLLDVAGTYDIKVETGKGKLVAEDVVYVR